MIKWLIEALQAGGIDPGFFRLIDYITFRAMMVALTALAFNLIWGHKIICYLHNHGMKDSSGDFQALNVHSKRGTPTAGGIMIMAATIFSLLLWADLSNLILLILLSSIIYFGLVGFFDDFLKSRYKSSLTGLSQIGKTSLILLYIVPFALFFVSSYNPLPEEIKTSIYLPFLSDSVLDLGPILFVLFIIFTMFAIINAVNISDGMDGLLGGLSFISVSVYALFAYIIGSEILAKHFLFPHIPGSIEITVFGAALVGSILGFLWYNFYPAEVFMGDTGSLALGSSLGLMSFFLKQEFLFLIVGGIFVLEIFTSLLNDKLANRSSFGRRIVHRAPFHYTITHRGVAEPKAVFRLLAAAIILALISLLSIKIR